MIEIEDEEFLSQVAAAEAEAVSSTSTKRRKISHSNTTAAAAAVITAKNQSDVVQEGAYIAALKGSKSHLFHQQFTSNSRNNNNNVNKSINNFNNNNNNSNNQVVFSDGGTCYKCRKVGHWARDCDANGNGDVGHKECPCGSGNCIVLTANTEKNCGRKFYKCPIRQENGGCGFFEWCDNSSGPDGITFRSQTNALNSSIPEFSCPCGAGSCLILTAKTGKNIGQQFYRCPAGQGSCGFFKWCNDHTITTSISSSVNTSPTYQNISGMNNKSYNASKFSCFKCGKEGHWAKDCEQSSSNSPADKIGMSASSGTCFKCGRPGHWAKDCFSTSETKVRFAQ